MAGRGFAVAVDPGTGREIARYPLASAAEIDAALTRASTAFRAWRAVSVAERSELLSRVADRLDADEGGLAELMTAEVGKPITESRAELAKCAWVCRYYAEHAAEMLADRHVATERAKSYVHHEPLGPILAVMPWNFPFWQVFRFAAPALLAGNVGILKHSSNVPGCALAIADLFAAAGFPDGVFSTLLIPAGEVGRVLAHPVVAAATLTGSEPAGAAVAAAAGSLLKKVVLELGGSDPYLVLEDADLVAAARTCAASRCINSGQSCIAAKRFIVHTDVYDKWLDLFVAEMANLRVGDPTEEATQIGPLARVDLRDQLHEQVLASVAAGARVVLGGEVPDGPGAFYPPTVLVDVAPGMPAHDDELFGPVAAVIRVESEEEAIRVANATRFGLGAAVFTRDVERGERIAATQLEAGTCVVNTFVASDPRLPFGGIKASGFGRELADLGIREFVNQKTVIVNSSD
ncbi:MAG: NAD-dependent succinate-semialdehyde dehydrogenase [Acidimicrobiia bacterium]|nr:NAD-dependent succinate-semialdehyde dehydrogenase [Acidimicrobiia bacterium]